MKKIVFLFLLALCIPAIPINGFAASYGVSMASGQTTHSPDESLIMVRGSYEINLIGNNKDNPFAFSLEPELIEFSGGQIGVAVGTIFKNIFSIGGGRSFFVSYGCGVMLTDGKLLGESLLFNFTPQGGVGFAQPIGGGKNFVVEIRYWHASNGGIKDPNSGIDDVVVFSGIQF